MYRSPEYVYSTICISGGLLGFYWPYKISKEFRRAGVGNISDEGLRKLQSAETHYKWMAIFHIVFWAVVILLGITFEFPRKMGLSHLLVRIGLFEVLLFFGFLVRLIFVFEKQFTGLGREPNIWLTIGSTILWLWSVRNMQKLVNMYCKH